MSHPGNLTSNNSALSSRIDEWKLELKHKINALKYFHKTRGYLVFGWIHMLDSRFGRPTHPSTKTFCLDPPIYQFFCEFLLLNSSIYQNLTLKPIHLPFFANFCSWTHLSTKILRSNPSIHQTFTLFLENDPPIYLHRPFKTHPSTSTSVSMKICESPPGHKTHEASFLILYILFNRKSQFRHLTLYGMMGGGGTGPPYGKS